MVTWVILLISCFGPILVLGGLVALINWVQDRFDPLKEHQRNITDMYQKQHGYIGIHFPQRAERESKSNPHYDALVDAEWKAAKRLEDMPPNDEDEHTLGDLLEKKDKR
jgi:hypothetical protein